MAIVRSPLWATRACASSGSSVPTLSDQARAGHHGPGRRRDIRLAESNLQFLWQVGPNLSECGHDEQYQHDTQSQNQYASHKKPRPTWMLRNGHQS